MIDELVRKGYDSDPVKAWKNTQTFSEDETAPDEDAEEEAEVEAGGADFDYLLGTFYREAVVWMLNRRFTSICR